MDDLDIDAIFRDHLRQPSSERISTGIADLKQAFADFHSYYPRFAPGDLVEWKPRLRNRPLEYNETAIVMRWLDVPVVNETEARNGLVMAMEAMDVEIGSFDDDGDFLLYLVNSRRLQPIKEEAY